MVFGLLPMMRSATSPACSAISAGGGKAAGRAGPAKAQLSAKAASRSATAGPRTSTPVSRHAGRWRAGSPIQAWPTHSPATKPRVPSTQIVLRWLRLSQPNGLSMDGRLKQRTSTPARRSRRQKPGQVPRQPIQSYSRRTGTPSCAFVAKASAKRCPAASSRMM